MSVNVSLLEKCAVLKSKLVIDANHVDPKPFYVVILATEHLERDEPRPIGSFLVLLGTFLLSDVTEVTVSYCPQRVGLTGQHSLG